VPEVSEIQVRTNRVQNETQARRENARAAKKIVEKLDHVVYDEDFVKNDEFGL
jgi:hypothetical protein